MVIASKYEEIFPPEMKNFVYIAANTYTPEQITRMERMVLSSIQFKVTFPTSNLFAQCILARQPLPPSPQQRSFVNMLLETFLVNTSTSARPTSQRARRSLAITWTNLIEPLC